VQEGGRHAAISKPSITGMRRHRVAQSIGRHESSRERSKDGSCSAVILPSSFRSEGGFDHRHDGHDSASVQASLMAASESRFFTSFRERTEDSVLTTREIVWVHWRLSLYTSTNLDDM